MDTIVLKINRHNQEDVLWAKVSEKGHVRHFETSISEISAEVGRHRLIVLVPGEDVLITKVNLPGGTTHSKQAIPFALEENLIEDVEKLHFAYGKKYSDGSRSIAIVSKKTMHEWLDFLSEAGLEPDLILPDMLALPVSNGNIVIAIDDCLALVRLGDDSGFAVDLDNLEKLVVSELQRVDNPLVQLYGLQIDQLQDEKLRSRAQEFKSDESLFSLMVGNIPKSPSLNLRQGSFGQNAQFSKISKSWSLPFLLIIFFLVVSLVNMTMEHNVLKSEDIELTSQMKKILLTSFPDSRRVVKPYAQMEYKLNNLRKSKEEKGNFVSLLNRVSPIIFKQSNSTTQHLRYKSSKIEVDLNVSNLKILDDIKLSLIRDADLDVEIKSAVSKGDYIFASLRISENRK